jgi:hypothetical protein
MRLREARDIRQHGGCKVGALDPQMVEHLRKTFGHRKIRCCHPFTPSYDCTDVLVAKRFHFVSSRSVFLGLHQRQLR